MDNPIVLEFTNALASCSPPFNDPPGYLPKYVEREVDVYLKCGRLEEGFLRVRCEHFRAENLVAFSWRREISTS